MIIFARAPGSTGWVEIKPEEELSHRGQFWEIRKFAVESDGIMPLARRLARAEQALRMAGFVDQGAKGWEACARQKWMPPEYRNLPTVADFAALLPGNCYLDEPDGGSVTVLEQVKRMAADAAKWRERPKAPERGAGHVLATCAAWLKTPSISAADPELANAFANDLIKIRYELKGLHE